MISRPAKTTRSRTGRTEGLLADLTAQAVLEGHSEPELPDVGDRMVVAGKDIMPFTLPAAAGGNGTLTYDLFLTGKAPTDARRPARWARLDPPQLERSADGGRGGITTLSTEQRKRPRLAPRTSQAPPATTTAKPSS